MLGKVIRFLKSLGSNSAQNFNPEEAFFVKESLTPTEEVQSPPYRIANPPPGKLTAKPIKTNSGEWGLLEAARVAEAPKLLEVLRSLGDFNPVTTVLVTTLTADLKKAGEMSRREGFLAAREAADKISGEYESVSIGQSEDGATLCLSLDDEVTDIVVGEPDPDDDVSTPPPA